MRGLKKLTWTKFKLNLRDPLGVLAGWLVFAAIVTVKFFRWDKMLIFTYRQ